MATIEQVEKLRERANVTYDEAKKALEAVGGDLLDAMIYLEKNGKVAPPENNGYYSLKDSKDEAQEEKKQDNQKEKHHYEGETFGQLLGRFVRWIGRVIAKGNTNLFEVHKGGEVIISVPVTVLVLLLLFAFWIVVPLIVIGLFFGCRYLFRGPDLEKTGVNKVMDSAADAAENLKKEVKDNHDDHHK